MLEESISCSPGCETKRSQSRRLHSRFKRKHQRREHPTSPADVSCLTGLYEESDHALNSTQYENFNPFQNEKLLVAVDMVRVPKSPCTSKGLPSRGFVKLEDIPIREDDDVQEPIQELSPPDLTGAELHAQYGPETQFGITESEFVRFCDDAEMDVQEPPSSPTESPQKKKMIVCSQEFQEHPPANPSHTPGAKKSVEKAILEDFCSSSYIDGPTKFVADVELKEDTPANLSETPQAKKSIVEAILEDFCASPYSESPPKTIAENATPIFRFRSTCIRTYAGTRRRKLRRNIDIELANAHNTDDDDGSVSDSSGLSVQEDLTQSVVPQLDTVDLNSSIKVCENLLHLSSYFSQSTSHDKTPQSSEPLSEVVHKTPQSSEERSRRLFEVVEELIQLQRRSYEITRRKSSDEFYGFSDGDSIEEFYGFSDEEQKPHEDTLKELLDAEDDFLQHINCDSLCYEKVQPKTSFSHDASEMEFSMDRVKSVIDDAKKFMESIDGKLGAEESEKSRTICDSLKSPKKPSQDSSVKEEALFEDIDLWNDNECLLNYVTQKPNPNLEACRVEKQMADSGVLADVVNASGFGFSTASKKPIAISEEGKRKANEFWTKFEQMEKEREAVELGDCSSSNADDKAEHTASLRKPLESEATKLNAVRILRGKGEPEVHPSCSSTSTSPKAHSSRHMSTPTFKRNENQTKSNELSDEVKQKAEELLKDIEFFEDGFDEEHKAEKACIEGPPSKPLFQGFRTASKKPISVSDEAKRRADLLIKDVKAEDIPNDFLESLQADLKHDSFAKAVTEDKARDVVAFEGFKTASKKPIQISEAARLRAEQISKDVQAADLPREVLECIQADLKDGPSSSGAGKAQDPTDARFEGFKTASKKPIQISEAARLRAEQISKDVQAAELPREVLECIQDDLEVSRPSMIGGTEQGSSVARFEGFKTASRKQIQISDVAKQRAEQMLKEIKTAALPQDFLKCIEADLNVNSSSAPAADGVPHPAPNQTQMSDAVENPAEELRRLPPEVVECIASDGRKRESEILRASPQKVVSPHNSPQKINEPDHRRAIKRKADILTGESSLNTPKRRFSCNERTPLNDIENAPLHKTASHPDIKSTQKIVKKNLLSLSKRKKCNSSKQPPDTSAASKTPEKSDSSLLRCNANTTPNLKEFFDCVATSTPRLIRTNANKVASNQKDSSIDADFQRICWEKTNTLTDLNVTCVQVSPSPQQRIERLKMYAEPPPISPILMVNKCRPSGLRRGRSIMKP